MNNSTEKFTGSELPPHFVCRKFNVNDLSDIKTIHTECFPVKYNDEFFDNLFKDDVLTFGVECTKSNHLVGVVTARIIDNSLFTPEYEGYIITLGVLPNHHKKGIGSHLLYNIMTVLLEKGCSKISLHMKPNNVVAHHFYLRHGFMSHRIFKDYYEINGQYYDGCCLVYRTDPKKFGGRLSFVKTIQSTCKQTFCKT